MRTTEEVIEEITQCPVLFIERRKAGMVEYRESVFDTVLTRLWLYELTNQKKRLVEGIRYLEQRAQYHNGHVYWPFSPSLPLPPDADTTATAFLLIVKAREEGIPIPEVMLPERNLPLFRELQDAQGRLYTWFGNKKPYYDNDPVVHATVAELYARVNVRNDLYASLQEYCNETCRTMTLEKDISLYYRGGYFFAYRLASLLRYDQSFLPSETTAHLDTLLHEGTPSSSLDAALLSRAARYRGLDEEVQRYNCMLEQAEKEDGFYPWLCCYPGNGWEYGHPFITTLLVLTALQLPKIFTPGHT